MRRQPTKFLKKADIDATASIAEETDETEEEGRAGQEQEGAEDPVAVMDDRHDDETEAAETVFEEGDEVAVLADAQPGAGAGAGAGAGGATALAAAPQWTTAIVTKRVTTPGSDESRSPMSLQRDLPAYTYDVVSEDGVMMRGLSPESLSRPTTATDDAGDGAADEMQYK